MAKALKVFRTAIGFHDAYVAAPSRKAALEAWGTTKDLFARGAAEVVDDPALAKEPLANPGVVIKRSRGSAADQIAALPKTKARKAAPKPEPAESRRPPKPSRRDLQAAQERVEALKTEHAAERDALDREEQALAKKRAATEKRQRGELGKAEAAEQDARDAYERALADWEP